MDPRRIIGKVNTKPVNDALIFCALSLLGLNFLLYSFFDLGGVRNLVRAGVAALLLVLLVFRLADDALRRRQVAALLLAAYQILIGGTNGLNIAFLLVLTVVIAGDRSSSVSAMTFWIMAALTALVAFCLLFGIEENEVYTIGDRTRHKLGFVNVNGASMFLFSLQCAFLLSRKGGPQLRDLAIVGISEFILFQFTDSRTPLIGIAALIAMYLVLPAMPRPAARFCMNLGVTVMFLTAFLWPLPALNSPLGNSVLSLRPEYFTDYIAQQSPLTFLFGGSRVKEVDNAFLLLLYNTGFPVYTAAYCLVLKACGVLLKKRSFMKLSYVLTMLICSAFEGSAIRPELLCAPVMWIIVFENLPGRGSESLFLARAKLWLALRLKGKEGPGAR